MKQEKFRYVIRKLTEGFTVTKIAAIILGAAITTFLEFIIFINRPILRRVA